MSNTSQVRVGEAHIGECIFGLDFEYGDVCARIGTHKFGFKNLVVVGGNFNFVGLIVPLRYFSIIRLAMGAAHGASLRTSSLRFISNKKSADFYTYTTVKKPFLQDPFMQWIFPKTV